MSIEYCALCRLGRWDDELLCRFAGCLQFTVTE